MKTKLVEGLSKKVLVSELSQMRDMVATSLGGDHLDRAGLLDESQTKKVSEMMLYRNYLAALSILEINDEKLPIPASQNDVIAIMAQFTKKEWGKILLAYTELNEDDEEEQKENLDK